MRWWLAYVPRFIRHYLHRIHDGHSMRHRFRSTRERMRLYH